ncbi:Na+/H+ antiporter NhaA [Ancylobacter dichloromethanicus]|uniref:Na+/H+ antiporter NhaA n=1 Tax=Ancylobacter dichloromethanicus TaxID=518825 RepID=UPI001BCB1A1E|nr:Na+/H+ antiporter NhaA [Ancylobacter dichloromethanicus]MBS7552212.1 Na+/H+ antiporter NhaA [Ancylobacter dichloromethanicus]
MRRRFSRVRLRTRLASERAFVSVQRFLHIEAVSGVVLLGAAVIALAWANSSAAQSYHDLWHAPLSLGLGPFVISQSLHFWINDALMTVFFLVVGMEIRREIHEGSLADMRSAALPMVAALGGVIVPAAIYLAFNGAPPARDGWAVPTATDIAFAVGVLALLGKAVPVNLRIFLLALAIIDDIVAILIIALFYSGGLDYSGLLVAGGGIALVVVLQMAGIGSAYAYILPGAILWIGLLQTGAHPTLAGVILGMMTPVLPVAGREPPLQAAARALEDIRRAADAPRASMSQVIASADELRLAQRELVPPVTRVQMTLHPWVAYLVMPLFALANAGVSLDGLDLARPEAQGILVGVVAALVLGKPLGVVGASWLVVRMGWATLPAGVNWAGVLLVGLLAGIGFTMSIFIATLAFEDAALLGAAKLGVLLASVSAAVLGLIWGALRLRGGQRAEAEAATH